MCACVCVCVCVAFCTQPVMWDDDLFVCVCGGGILISKR